MKRWNGWGSDKVEYHVPSSAQKYLAEVLRQGHKGPDARFEDVIRNVRSSRLPDHPLINKDPGLRLRHARGQSLPDWIALRFGTVDLFPDGVAQPSSEEDVGQVIATAKEIGARIIPYGGGTSVVGHINPLPDDRPVLTVNLARLRRMTHLDKKSRLAAFGAGVTGPHLEAQLRSHEFTLGHFPQSFEYSTLGGWIATRSSGQQSLYYGRIEDLFAGGRMITPKGYLNLPPFPASAAGPDLRQVVLGSEGRLGIVTKAFIRVSPLAEQEKFHAVFFPDWDQGMTALYEMVQSRLPVSMLRFSDALETNTALVLAGRERIVRLLHRLLRARGLGEDKCMLIFGVTGRDERVRKTRREALDVARSHGGVHVGRRMGNEWYKNRFRTPYLRNTLWELGYAVDTLETAFLWCDLPAGVEAIVKSLSEGLKDIDEHVLAFAHISHAYKTGASIYVTYLFRITANPEETLARWQNLKDEASKTVVNHGGTISHQHGVGVDHLPYLKQEKGELGMSLLSSMAREFDPEGIMNPGKLMEPKTT